MSDRSRPSLTRVRLLVQGQVQGVGFRPFVFRLAHELGLTGHVGNTSEGVAIEIQGTADGVARFPGRLRAELPPLARLTALETSSAAVVPDETAFTIVMSSGRHGHHVLISPDVGLCADCAADMRDPANPRYRYAFTNCTNCGPRYTITRSIPYDRAVTSMACFPMCPSCAEEYANPLDRRFHAQPVACPRCGPRLWFVSGADGPGPDTTPCPEREDRAVERACMSLLAGRILALRGLGGFQLACDARSEAAVMELRRRKRRPAKSFALMAKDLAQARSLCRLGEAEERLLASPARPAVIAPRREGALPDAVAPDILTLAVMLPTTPLHVVLFDTLSMMCRERGLPEPVLVMTSGNAAGDPICLGNREALRRLAGTADDFLLHDRDILCRVDDSVVCARDGGDAFFFRRARGYVPSPIPLAHGAEVCVFGAGADLKATCCFTRGADAFVGQHTGDLDNAAAADFYDEVVAHLGRLLEVTPGVVVADLHPDFHSARAAAGLAERCGAAFVRLQHHAAHAAACLAEARLEEPTPVIVLDGYGYGPDGTVWGGELLEMDLGGASWRRLGHLSGFALPGGDAATRAPWRIAVSLASGLGDAALGARVVDAWTERMGHGCRIIRQMLERGFNSPSCSSCGRLFDAVSAQLDVCLETSYEGQAAIRLESLALRAARGGSLPAPEEEYARMEEGQAIVDSRGLFARVCRLREQGLDAAAVALDFHVQLARALAQAAAMACPAPGRIGLCGGVLNNTLLRRHLAEELARRGFTAVVPALAPAGDGGVSLGQAAWGVALARAGKIRS